MKTNTFSIVVGDHRCNAACPYCVSKMTHTAAAIWPSINTRRFETACRVVKQASDGLIGVLLTGKGEPTLFPGQITEYLNLMGGRFPLVDLQTNGILIRELAKRELGIWRDAGLTLVCISIAHYLPGLSNREMGIKDDTYNFWDAVDLIHTFGLAVRLNCTMLDGTGFHSVGQLEALVAECQKHGVEQITLREVERPDDSKNPEIAAYVDERKPRMAAARLRQYILECGGTELMQLAHGASVFDFLGQNVCISNCLTATTDPDDIRQIIYFPDGRIAYDWQYTGARIL